jgi:hypothetical protein
MRVMPTTFFDPIKLDVEERLDRGVALMKQNRFAEGIVEFEEVLKIDPTNFYAKWDRCWGLLSLGDYTNGMPNHDSAWERPFDHGLGSTLPVWQGERCRLICYDNMGFGDGILTLRFLPEIVRRCESVTLVAKPELVSLMRGHGANVVDRVPEDGSIFDAHVSMFNSIHIMGYTRETIPNKPYIKVDFKFSGGKMGIAWSGTTRKELDLFAFLSRLDTRGFELYSLQKTCGGTHSVPEGSALVLGQAGITPSPRELQVNDFKETAELMAILDCIITVDTAAANLAGAIGHPNAHVVMPYFRDWRWWYKDVWYPTLKIYPQYDANNWDGPFVRMNEAIHGSG